MADFDTEDYIVTRLSSVGSKSNDKTSDVVLDGSDHCSSDTEVTSRRENSLSQPTAPFAKRAYMLSYPSIQ